MLQLIKSVLDTSLPLAIPCNISGIQGNIYGVLVNMTNSRKCDGGGGSAATRDFVAITRHNACFVGSDYGVESFGSVLRPESPSSMCGESFLLLPRPATAVVRCG